MRRSLWLLLLISLLAGCEGDVPSNDYFPLREGMTWHYRVEIDDTKTITQRLFSIRNAGTAAFGDKYFDIPIRIRRTSDGTDYYILDAEDGRYRIAKKTIIELKPRFDERERKILPHSDEIDVGQVWINDGNTYMLRGDTIDVVPDTADVQLSMEYEVASMTDTVEVPAGRFENCVRLEATAGFSLYVDPRLGYEDILITQTEWYAPGVGLIKLERKEPREIGLFRGGSMLFELLKLES